MNPWWRAYVETIDDPKLLLLPSDAHRWAWFSLCCLASAYGGVLPPLDVIALKLRKSKQRVFELIADLATAGLIDTRPDGTLEPHNWVGRQYLSDSADPTHALRQKRYRSRQRDGGDTVTRDGSDAVTRDVTRDGHAPYRDRMRDAAQSTETEAETEPSKEPDGSSEGERAAKKSPRATRLPADWMPTAEGLEFARSHGLGEIDINRESERFANYWTAKSGRDATKLDWQATWRNWVLRATDRRPNNGPGPAAPSLGDRARDLAAEIRREERARGIGRPDAPVRGG